MSFFSIFQILNLIFDGSVDIKVWMATGDKLETAVSVAHASNLIRNSFKKVYLLWAENLEKVYLEVSQAVKIYKSKRYKVALVIEGRVLSKPISKISF